MLGYNIINTYLNYSPTSFNTLRRPPSPYLLIEMDVTVCHVARKQTSLPLRVDQNRNAYIFVKTFITFKRKILWQFVVSEQIY